LAHLKARCPALLRYTSRVPQNDVINWSYNGKLDPTKAPYGSTILIAVSKGVAPVRIPGLAGQSYTRAASTLGAEGLVVKEAQAYSTTVVAGQVISTTPAGGRTAFPGWTVTVTVSKGPATVPVPTVIGDTVSHATAAIEATGLSIGAVYGPATGVVFTTDPLAGQMEKIGTPIALYTEAPPPTGNGPSPASTRAGG
jgi:beta-lactam-binding protein with PASTA domain